jgi:hypothetical protein
MSHEMTIEVFEKIAELESHSGVEFGFWANNVFENFSYWRAFQSSRFFACPVGLLNELKSWLQTKERFCQVFTAASFGVPCVYGSRAELERGLVQDLDFNKAYFLDAFPDGAFDLSAYGFVPVDLRLVRSNLNQLTASKGDQQQSIIEFHQNDSELDV